MLGDANKLAWAMAEVGGYSCFLSPRAPKNYQGATDDGYVVGEPGSDRLLIPHPTRNLEVFNKPLALKKAFLEKVHQVSKHMKGNDILFVGISSHGRENDGAAVVGDFYAPHLGQAFISTKEFGDAISSKLASTHVVLWVSTGFWVQGDWETLAAAGTKQESQSFPKSPSGYYRGGLHDFSTFIAHGRNSGVTYPFRAGPGLH
ncbi:hypothetical protein DXG03_009309 [Asterophora parasitica]|uniref:Uncharacterized protein n=1 Tax=Asterophora parasitica TaxID=117018 RepID=A0A9P7G5I9_9AGAR|nr:hypothetical protein DXG03_009309 [Asterophora parasitica]